MYKKFTFIVLLVVVLIGPIGQFFLFKFTPLYNLNLLSELYNEASWVKGKPKIAIMGSSHARYHIIPSEIAKLNKGYAFKDIVNIGENAASPFAMYTSFMKNREKFTNLKTVYYTLEPHMLGEKYYPYNAYEEIFLNYSQWKYLELNHKKKNNYFFPFQTFVKSLKFKNSNRSKTNGYSRLKHKEFKPFTKGRVSKLIYEPLELFPVSSFGMEAFKKLKQELDKQGTELIFVLTPTYSWQKYYALEAKEYDTVLIKLLNKSIGPVKVIGSFWPKDFDLNYQDFKDDTHMAHSGALRFTKEIFSDLDSHQNLQTEPLKNTYLYRYISKSPRKKEVSLKSINASSLKWKYNKNVYFQKKGNFIITDYTNITKFTLLETKFPLVKNVSSVTITISKPKESFKMFSITLKYGKEYAHFFIKPNEIQNGILRLSENTLGKKSNKFEFNKLDGIAIRVYPNNTTEVHGLEIQKIMFNTIKG